MQKSIDVSCVNRIKYETGEEFNSSLFSGVYYRAVRLVKHIVRQNREKNYIPDPEFCKDEQLNNVIAFLGERGVGKSSAMLSFALFLKSGAANKPGRYQLDQENIAFSVLPRIDVAMMVKGERLLDVVLARMWDSFEEKYKLQAGWKENSLEKVKECFRKVKRDYAIYLSTIADEVRITKTSSIEELHNLAAALNLKEEIKGLVDCYLQCMLGDERTNSNNNYLVLAIDDLDLANENVYDILEQLRIFLVIPKVIVLLTADIDRMVTGCVKNISTNMCSELFDDEINKKLYHDAEKYVNNYLAKIIPQNMRVEMPDITKIGTDEYRIHIDGLGQKLYKSNAKKAEKEGKVNNEKKILLSIIYRWTGILFSAKQSRRHYLQGASLRKMVNNLYDMSEALGNDEVENSRYVMEWLQSQLESLYAESVEIEDINERKLIKELWNAEPQKYNKIILEYFLEHNGNKELKESLKWYYDYGEMLLGLSLLSKKARNFIMLLYSIQLRNQKNDPAEMDIFIGNEIFQEMIRRGPFNNQEINGIKSGEQGLEISQIGNRLQIKLMIEGDIREASDIGHILSANWESILQDFCIANLCDYGTWETIIDENNEFEAHFAMDPSSDTLDDVNSAAYVTLSPLQKPSTALLGVDNILLGVMEYETRLKKYIEKIYFAVCKLYEIENAQKGCDSIINHVLQACKIGDYIKWKEKNKVNSMMDLLPLQSIELIYEMACGIKTFGTLNNSKFLQYSFYERLTKRLNYIVDVLEKAEEYVGMQYMEGSTYSAKLKEYFKIMKIFELPAGKVALINTLDNIEQEQDHFEEADEFDEFDFI